MNLRGGVQDTTFEAKAKAKNSKKSEVKAKDRLFEGRPSWGQGREWSRPRPRIEDTNFLNYGKQIFYYFMRESLSILHFVKFLMIIQK